MSDIELVNQGIPLRTKVWKNYDGIDKGIRFAVRVLHSHGIETGQSCEGGDGHAYDHPTVDLAGGARYGDGFAALHFLTLHGLSVETVELVWTVDRGLIADNFWRIVLTEARPDLADHDLMFLWGYQAQPDKDALGDYWDTPSDERRNLDRTIDAALVEWERNREPSQAEIDAFNEATRTFSEGQRRSWLRLPDSEVAAGLVAAHDVRGGGETT